MKAAKNKQKGMMARMRRMMLTCDEATFLISKLDLEKLSFKDKINLHLHLMACRHCRNYSKQINILSEALRQKVVKINKSQFPKRLSAAEKSELQDFINIQTKKS